MSKNLSTKYEFVRMYELRISRSVEVNGFEPMTLCVQGRCSSQLSYTPKLESY